MPRSLLKNEKPVRDLHLGSGAFENTARAAEVKSGGCNARLGGSCTRLAVAVVGEGEAPGPTTPAWSLHAVCENCGRALGLLPRDVA